MAINYELINKGGISLGTNFELLGEKPLDARLVVPSLDGLAHLIAEKAAYTGMIVYVTAEAKHYQVNADGSYREFGINADELKALIASETTAAMEFKGATTTLPENPSKGDMWKVASTFSVDEEEVKVGDSIVYNGEQWFVIPSGDDIEDTWRPVDGVANNAGLKFEAGAKLDVAVANDGTITYSHEVIDAPELLGENEQTRTYITEVTTDDYGHIIGYKTATENVVDTNTEYEFTSQIESSSVYFQVDDNKEGSTPTTVYVDAYSQNEIDNKVKALNLEIYGNESVQETSRIDTAVDNAAEALRVAGVAAGDASTAKGDAAEALRIAGEANVAASEAKTGAAASASAAADSAREAAASQSAAAGSAQAAASSANAASGSAAAALASQNAASASETNAAASASGAAQSASDASASAAAAAKSAEDAAREASNAGQNATNAGDSARAAAKSAEDAGAAKLAAVDAQGKAEIAQGKAESAQAAAETAKKAAEDSNASATAIANAAKAAANQATETANSAKGIADTALQEVVAKDYDAEGKEKISGLKVTNKNEIAIDDSAVFVFNCGSSTTLID